MAVYANILGNWTKLSDEVKIDGLSPQDFIENALMSDDEADYFNKTPRFVEVFLDNTAYHIHISQIQFTYKK